MINPNSGDCVTITLQWPERSGGITGLCHHNGLIYCGVQGGRGSKILSVDPWSWNVLQVYDSPNISDVHSLIGFEDQILAVSSGNNSIYSLTISNNRICSDKLFWRAHGTSAFKDEVHLNALTLFRGRLIGCCFGQRSKKSGWNQNTGYVFDVQTGAVILGGLRQPHSICNISDQIYLCESRLGQILTGMLVEEHWLWDRAIVGGYPRGLVSTGDKLVIGVSSSRRVSRIHGTPVPEDGELTDECQIITYSQGEKELLRIIDLGPIAREIYDLAFVHCQWPKVYQSGSRWRRVLGRVLMAKKPY